MIMDSSRVRSVARLLVPVGLAALALAVFFLFFNRHSAVRNPTGAVLQGGGPEFDPIRSDEIQSILPEDAIPAITRPEYLPVSAASDIRDDEQVIGLFINGQARAFPTATLSVHEIVDDVIGGQPVAVTW